jgi:small subunit ribosomal protein S2
VDTKKEETAVMEANRLSIPVIGLIDTNSNPDLITYPIPGNDDATKSIHTITRLLADSIIEGRKRFLSYLSQEGVTIKPVKEEATVVLPEEELKIKEIEEIVETTTPPEEGVKPARKVRARPATEGRARARKKEE